VGGSARGGLRARRLAALTCVPPAPRHRVPGVQLPGTCPPPWFGGDTDAPAPRLRQRVFAHAGAGGGGAAEGGYKSG